MNNNITVITIWIIIRTPEELITVNTIDLYIYK